MGGNVRRREFIAGLSGAAVVVPLQGKAQEKRKPPIIGWLGGTTPEAGKRNLNALLRGLREHGHEDGKDVSVVYRWAGGSASPLPELANEIISLNPAVIFAVINGAALACRKVTTSIPIVCPLLVDPVKTGLAESYNRPSRNVTGVLQTVDTLPAKQVELLLKVSPRATAIGVLFNPESPTAPILFSGVEAAVRGTTLRIVRVEARRPDDISVAFDEMKKGGVNCLIVLQDPMFFAEDARINALAEAARLPTMHGFRQNVERGGLMSYGVDIPQNFRRAAYFVDRILKGVPPGDLPIELPAKLELVINSKTAKAIGLVIPSNLLFTADEIIE